MAGAISQARGPTTALRVRTGCSTNRNESTATPIVTVIRRTNSGTVSSPVRSGVSHRKIGQCSR